MKKSFSLLILLTLFAALAALCCCVDTHTHEAAYFPAAQPNCLSEGSSGYYYCAGCKKYFSDAACTREISKDQAVLPKNDDHDWGEWEQTSAPDCTHAGERVRACMRCGKSETQTLESKHTLVYPEYSPPARRRDMSLICAALSAERCSRKRTDCR